MIKLRFFICEFFKVINYLAYFSRYFCICFIARLSDHLLRRARHRPSWRCDQLRRPISHGHVRDRWNERRSLLPGKFCNALYSFKI